MREQREDWERPIPDDPFELRPVQRTDGSGLWDALDANGHGYVLGVQYEGSAGIWIAGYNTGAEDNQ